MDKPPDQKTKPRIAAAERRVKPLARLLRCATALRVTAPLGCGSRRLVWPKGSLSAPGLYGSGAEIEDRQLLETTMTPKEGHYDHE